MQLDRVKSAVWEMQRREERDVKRYTHTHTHINTGDTNDRKGDDEISESHRFAASMATIRNAVASIPSL